jgi:uncharacterized protein with von Willebrand factor type A (vWA) domain
MPIRKPLGGIVHSYQRYDPVRIPPPRPPETDLATPAVEHMLATGGLDGLTAEQLVEAVVLDPEQIRGLGPSLDALRARLEERKQRILSTYETDSVRQRARQAFHRDAAAIVPPRHLANAFLEAVTSEQMRRLERFWYAVESSQPALSAAVMKLLNQLSTSYELNELAAGWQFTGRTPLSIDEALATKEELETIDRLLAELEEARKNAKVGLIDMDALGRYAEAGELDDLARLRQQVQELIERAAAEQGLDRSARGYQLTPQAIRAFQGKLLEQIFSDLTAAKTGRHAATIAGEGAVEMVPTRPFEFGDSVAHLDLPGSLTNAMLRRLAEGGSVGPDAAPLQLDQRDLEVHRTRNSPKAATVVVLDMSGSMRYGGLYINVKRMALALQGLIQREYPGDFLQFIEMASFAKPRSHGELVSLLPKPVTVFDPVVRLRADMTDPTISESDIPPHFTNIQHALQLSRQFLASQDTPNQQVIVITDGLPTAHFEDQQLYLLYPPHGRTEEATIREARRCQQAGIMINVFLLSGWSQSREDIQFAYRLAETAQGRVAFAAGHELDRFVVWDYHARRRSIIG